MKNIELTNNQKQAVALAEQKDMYVNEVIAFIKACEPLYRDDLTPEQILDKCEKHYVGTYDTLQEFAEDNATDANHFPNTFNYVDWTKYIDYLFNVYGDFLYYHDEEEDKYFIFTCIEN